MRFGLGLTLTTCSTKTTTVTSRPESAKPQAEVGPEKPSVCALKNWPLVYCSTWLGVGVGLVLGLGLGLAEGLGWGWG